MNLLHFRNKLRGHRIDKKERCKIAVRAASAGGVVYRTVNPFHIAVASCIAEDRRIVELEPAHIAEGRHIVEQELAHVAVDRHIVELEPAHIAEDRRTAEQEPARIEAAIGIRAAGQSVVLDESPRCHRDGHGSVGRPVQKGVLQGCWRGRKKVDRSSSTCPRV